MDAWQHQNSSFRGLGLEDHLFGMMSRNTPCGELWSTTIKFYSLSLFLAMNQGWMLDMIKATHTLVRLDWMVGIESESLLNV